MKQIIKHTIVENKYSIKNLEFDMPFYIKFDYPKNKYISIYKYISQYSGVELSIPREDQHHSYFCLKEFDADSPLVVHALDDKMPTWSFSSEEEFNSHLDQYKQFINTL